FLDRVVDQREQHLPRGTIQRRCVRRSCSVTHRIGRKQGAHDFPPPASPSELFAAAVAVPVVVRNRSSRELLVGITLWIIAPAARSRSMASFICSAVATVSSSPSCVGRTLPVSESSSSRKLSVTCKAEIR